MNKIIGITPRLFYEKGVEKQFVNTRYINFLRQFDLNFLILPLSSTNIIDILSLCDGFLITGGDDVNPYLYKQKNLNSNNINNDLDSLDLKVIDFAVQKKMPLMGICRGIQIINVYFKGSLIQDIANHQNSTHKCTISDNPYLNENNITTNSFHHQAISLLGDDLKAFCISDDGIIEGIYHNNLPILAIQWHPEINSSSIDTTLFRNFINLKLKSQPQ